MYNIYKIIIFAQEHTLFAWYSEHAYDLCFPSHTQDISNPALVDDPSKDPQYQESAIDSLRSQRDEVCDTKQKKESQC